MLPLVSIIVPTYNRASIIPETIQSIINQTYVNWECIIVDDNSDDNTKIVIDRYIDKYTNIKYYKLPDNRLSGGNAARNFGFEKCSGEYVTWLDSDDIIISSKIESQINLIKDTNFDCCICQTSFFNDTDKFISNWNKNLYSHDLFNDFLQKKIGWSINAPIYRKSFLLKNNLVFDELLTNAQDYDFHIRVLSIIENIKFICDELVLTRVHSESIRNTVHKGKSKLIVYKKIINDYPSRLTLSSNKFIYNEIENNISKSLINGEIIFIIKFCFFLLLKNCTRYYRIILRAIPKILFSYFYSITGKGYSLIKR